MILEQINLRLFFNKSKIHRYFSWLKLTVNFFYLCKMKNAFILAVIALCMSHCANIVPPSGGLKDTLAPILLSVEKNENVIHVFFDENIIIKNPANFYTSPPLEDAPLLKTKNKRLTIEGEWLENVCYSLHFPSVIADYNENNLISDLHITTSKCEKDTLYIKGSVKAETEAQIWALLYSKSNMNPDSLLFRGMPNYIAKVDEDMNFTFPNLPDTTFWLFALVDNDQNLKYNLSEESVGFYPNSIKPNLDSMEIIVFNEYAIADSLHRLPIDSLTKLSKLLIDSLPSGHILELIYENKVVKRMLTNLDAIQLDSLKAGQYKIRLIDDENENGIWDTGKLSERVLAEKFRHFPSEIIIREDWDLEISWKE